MAIVDETFLTLTFKNQSPVELLDLTASLDALGRHYIDFVHSQGYDQSPENVRLYIDELRSGSIVAVLKDIADQASFIYDHRDVLGAFLANFDDLVRIFVGISPLKGGETVSRQSAERVAQILEPVAKDGSSQLFLQVTGNNNTIILGNEYSSERARAAQEGVRRFLGPPIPSQGFFENELLFLHQVRDEVRAKSGDRGVIERFSSKPVKLVITSEEAKRTILERPYPFKVAFLVDGQVSTVRGEPALYKIYAVREVIDRP